MPAEANKDIVRRAGEAFGRGDWEALVSLMAEDVAYALIGSGQFSGTLHGRTAVYKMLTEGLAPKLSTPGIVMTIESLIAEGDFVVEQAHGSSLTRAGMPYNNSYCRVWHIRDGQVQAMTEYLDTELLERSFRE